jgi:hypothetical protein
MDFRCIFPAVIFSAISFPSHLKLELLPEHLAVQDLFHDVLLFSVDEFWRWRRSRATSLNRVRSGRSQLYDIEDWVKSAE